MSLIKHHLQPATHDFLQWKLCSLKKNPICSATPLSFEHIVQPGLHWPVLKFERVKSSNSAAVFVCVMARWWGAYLLRGGIIKSWILHHLPAGADWIGPARPSHPSRGWAFRGEEKHSVLADGCFGEAALIDLVCRWIIKRYKKEKKKSLFHPQ